MAMPGAPATVMHAVNRWLAGAAAGLLTSVVIAEAILALLTLVTGNPHLLSALTLPEAAASAAPAWLAVVWLGAATVGAALATAWAGQVSAALPTVLLPAASLYLVTWYFGQPGMVGAVVITGPVLGGLLGIAAASTLVRSDEADAATATTSGSGI